MAEMMVQNLISQRQAEQNPTSVKNRMPKPSDYQKYQVGAVPYEAKGHLVHTPIWKSPVVAVEDIYKNIKNVGKGLEGKSNDHELGQMNDLAMKAGGLALAGYLATTRMLPTKKGMEFVGFASFFASMVLFPKLFINAPIKAMYGFNWDQKYVDSYGRKKPFHMDPQYTPYDLYAPEKLEAIGDKMGVDKDMENRQDFIKRKMTKIATQANTLWMLTAGLATPIMSALISSGIEKGLNEAQKTRKTNQVNKKLAELGENLSNADAIAEQKFDKKGFETLSNLLSANKDKAIDEQFVEQLIKLIDKGSNLKLENHLRTDLNKIIGSGEISNISEFLGDIEINVSNNFGSEKILFSKDEIKQALIASKKDLSNTAITPDASAEIRKGLTDLFRNKTKNSDDALLGSLNQAFASAIDSKFQNPQRILTGETIDKIKDVFKVVDSFRVKQNILNEYISHRIGKKEDSIMATQWKKTSEGIMNALGFSHEELKQIKKAPAKSGEIMAAKMTVIVKNDIEYKKVLEKIAEMIHMFDKEIEQGISGEDKKGFKAEVEEMTKKFYGGFATKAKNSSLDNVADYVAGNEFLINFTKKAENEGSEESKEKAIRESKAAVEEYLKKNKTARIIDKDKNIVNDISKSSITNITDAVDSSLIGARNTLYKVIQGLDMFRRLEKATPKQKLDDDVIRAMKHAIMDGTYGDHFVKLNIVDPEQYKAVMTNLFSPELNDSTKTILKQEKNGNLLVRFQEQMKNLRNQLGNVFYGFKPGNQTDFLGTEQEKAAFVALGDSKKQMMLGDSLSGLVQKTAEGMHNTKHWQRLFGGIGAGVAVVALISPFFFGKMEAPEKKEQKEVTNNG